MRIDVQGYQVHVEVHGQAQSDRPPLLILNGIMMSTASWQPLLGDLCQDRQVVLMDFLDQGQSDRLEGGSYDQTLQVDAVLAVMDHLAHTQWDLLGISYGGQVAMQVALANPQGIRRLVLANTALWTSPILKDIGDSWTAAAQTGDIEVFFPTCMPMIYGETFYQKSHAWLMDRKLALGEVLQKSWYDGFIRLVRSAETYDIRDRFVAVDLPTLLISGDEDRLTPLADQVAIGKGLNQHSHLVLGACGHASMYEGREGFTTALVGFLR